MHGSSAVLTLADFIVSTRYEHLPRVVVDKAKTHILDTFGAALAGTRAEETIRAKEALSFGESGGGCAVLGKRIKTVRAQCGTG